MILTSKNIQSKLINTQTVSFLNYIDKHANIWIKDVQFTLDIIQAGYPKSIEIFDALQPSETQYFFKASLWYET